MIRINRWWTAFVALVVMGALFVDGYSLIYRYFVVHQPLGQAITTTPNINGFPLFFHKGLDLQGGTEVVVTICHGPNNPPSSTCRQGPKDPAHFDYGTAQQQTIPILTQRVNGLGVVEASVQSQGSDQILVQVPGVDVATAVQTVGTTARLHFALPVAGTPSASDAPYNTGASALGQPIIPLPTGYYWHVIDDKLPASNISSADTGYDTTHGPTVLINFNGAGADAWSKLTTDASTHCGAASSTASACTNQNDPQRLIAIYLDQAELLAPEVLGAQSSQASIFGSFTQAQVSAIAQDVNAGALPADISVISASQVTPTLGQDTVRKSLIAGGVGLAIVILFMLAYYRFPGLLASVALVFYTAITLAIYKLLGATISLPALAGFVLSVGMAVDANVLIFERTRDELRHGRTAPVAVELGFRRAFPAIRDSNVSTLITCFVLWYFGSNIIKGFAVTLGLGVAVSFFSAILITQSLFKFVLSRSWGRRPTWYTEIHEEYAKAPPKGHFDIVRRRNTFFFGSLLVLIPGILAIVFWHTPGTAPQGFRLGLDFSGGNSFTATLTENRSTTEVAAVVNGVASDLHPVVQAATRTTAGGYPYTITTIPSSIDRVLAVSKAIETKLPVARDHKTDNPDIQETSVGPTIAADLVRSAVILVLVSSLFIAGYLYWAFRRQRIISPRRFATCTFFKLLHDVFVLLGIWAILGHFSSLGEINSLFVTAVLTSVAFSIHDTIVVFDRVRENLRSGPRLTFDQTINLSTVQTMTRSLNTALTVVFVLLSLLIFGGDSIRGFVLALLIGIVTGTYSSIFNASTLLVAWHKLDEHRAPPLPPGRARAA